jgi:hypothetical protein
MGVKIFFVGMIRMFWMDKISIFQRTVFLGLYKRRLVFLCGILRVLFRVAISPIYRSRFFGAGNPGKGFAAPTTTKETITQKSEIAGYANAFTSATSTKGIATLDLKRGCYRVAIPSGAGNPGCKGLQPRPKA